MKPCESILQVNRHGCETHHAGQKSVPIGKPLAFVGYQIESFSNEQPLPNSTHHGELLIGGCTVFQGYTTDKGNEQENMRRRLSQDGYWRTGDAVSYNPCTKMIQVVGRIDMDVIKSPFGGLTSLREVAAVAEMVPKVKSAVCLNTKNGHILFVEYHRSCLDQGLTSRTNTSESDMEVFKVLKRELQDHVLPISIVACEIPLLENGKIDNQALREIAQGPRLRDKKIDKAFLQNVFQNITGMSLDDESQGFQNWELNIGAIASIEVAQIAFQIGYMLSEMYAFGNWRDLASALERQQNTHSDALEAMPILFDDLWRIARHLSRPLGHFDPTASSCSEEQVALVNCYQGPWHYVSFLSRNLKTLFHRAIIGKADAFRGQPVPKRNKVSEELGERRWFYYSRTCFTAVAFNFLGVYVGSASIRSSLGGPTQGLCR